MDQQLILYVCVGGAVSAVVFFLSRLTVGQAPDTKVRDRLTGRDDDTGKASVTKPGVAPLFQRVSAAAAEPFKPKTRENQSTMKRDLGYAGVYSPSAANVVNGAKFIFLLIGLIGGYVASLFFGNAMLYMPVGALVGYMTPKMWLRLRITANQKQLTLGLPDALDLMVVCVEAGLTVDSAMQRVGHELVVAHPAVARELGIAHMETRVGLSRQESLKNLGVRTGNAGLQSLAAMLIQADRFGTSIANALRIHADSMRTKRQHAAEEMAAKASVKLSFPLVLFIFPATFIVLAGPTVIGLMNSALFNE